MILDGRRLGYYPEFIDWCFLLDVLQVTLCDCRVTFGKLQDW